MQAMSEFHKIDRNGVFLWVEDPKEVCDGVYVGIVCGENLDSRYVDGDMIAFTAKERVGITNDFAWADKQTARLFGEEDRQGEAV